MIRNYISDDNRSINDENRSMKDDNRSMNDDNHSNHAPTGTMLLQERKCLENRIVGYSSDSKQTRVSSLAKATISRWF